MKKIILLLTFTSFIVNAQTTLTFDDSSLNDCDIIAGNNTDEVAIVTDPTDSSNKVLKIIHSTTTGWDNHGGVELPFGMNGALGGTFTFDIWTDHSAGTPGTYGYMLKLEGSPNGVLENSFLVDGAGSWQTVSIDITDCANRPGNCGNSNTSATATDTFSKLLFFHWGGSDPSAPAPDTLYIDNINYVDGDVLAAPVAPAGAITNVTIDFETDSGFEAAAGGISFTEANGYGTASLTNNDWWSNIQKTFDNPFDFSSGDKGFSMKVKGPRNSSITLKIEDSTDGGNNHEWRNDAVEEYDTPGQWKTILFDAKCFSSIDKNRIVIFFDIQTNKPTDESQDTFDVDDITFGTYASLSTNNLKEFTDINLYPNPATDFVNINSADSIDSYRIHDLTGRVVKRSSPYSNNFRIDVASLNKGVYLVKFNSGEKTGSTKLIIDN